MDGREKLLALGVYPVVAFADAHPKRDEAKKGIAGGYFQYRKIVVGYPPTLALAGHFLIISIYTPRK